MKIGVRTRQGWERRRKRLLVQETCIFEWKNVISEACRKGFVDEEELQWNSYDILTEQAKQEWLESMIKRKKMRKGSKRAPKSPEQRQKISEAIYAKWADPDYRARVCSGMVRYHGTSSTPRKLQKKTRTTTPARPKCNDKFFCSNTKTTINKASSHRSNSSPLFKDPLVSSKLKMIRKTKEKRVADEARETEAIGRAKLLIAEAERAAEALELLARKSPIAQTSLIETRNLIAQAKWYISNTSFAEGGHLSSVAQHKNDAKCTSPKVQMCQEMNTAILDYGKLQNKEEFQSMQTKASGSMKSLANNQKKKWVRGKLVAVLDDSGSE